MKLEELRHGTELLKRGFASMQKGGVIMDVVNASQAAIAEQAGAVAVMALERVPADIRKAGGVARMADPAIVIEIMDAVSIPVMAKVRIGHFVEAQVLESLGVDMIDESEVLTPADEQFHIDKKQFSIPFVCGARDLGEALRRIHEGAAMVRTKGEAGTGNVVEAVRHMRNINGEIRALQGRTPQEIVDRARDLEAPADLLLETVKRGRLPVVNFSAGGIATPADAAMMMQMGADGVFVGSGIFLSANPEKMARAIVEAVNHYDDPAAIAEASKGLGEPMKGLDVHTLKEGEVLQYVGVRIGVLALQGDVSEHIDAFRDAVRAFGSERSISVVQVRKPEEITGLDVLAIPGGESTTISRLIEKNRLFDPIIEFEGGIFATCAGMVVMAGSVDDPRVHPLGLMDYKVIRNAFGRQRDSFEADIAIAGLDRPFHAVFIRAPVAQHPGNGIKVLGSLTEGVVAMEQGRFMALSFHPEPGRDPRLHIRFLKNCGLL